ncbi:MAG: response regulator [Bdellovibrionales bacterium]|nr:response regulator [Bdellovibrionales bacterium]
MRKLLVADDSLTIQKVIRLALSNSPGEGYEIQTVSDGNDAIQQILLFRPHLVLIDVSLPGKNAFEVKAAINEHADLSEVRFVLMSSAFEKYDESQADSVGFHGKLTKPFDPAHLRSVLDQAIQQVVQKRMEKTEFIQAPLAASSAPGQAPAVPTLPKSAPEIYDPSKIIDLAPMKASEVEPVMGAIPPALPGDFSAAENWSVQGPGSATSPSLSMPPATPPAPPAAPSGGQNFSSDTDIKELTESTIRMSGLDQWALEEKTVPNSVPPSMPAHDHHVEDAHPAFGAEPNPPAGPTSGGGIAFEIGERTLSNLRNQTPGLPPLGAQADFSGIQFRIDDPTIDPLNSMPEFRPENAEAVESEESTLRLDPPSLDSATPGFELKEPTVSSQYDPEPEGEEAASISTFGSSAFSKTPPPPPSQRSAQATQFTEYSPQAYVEPAETHRAQNHHSGHTQSHEEISPLSDERLEMMIRKQLESQFQAVVERVLPQIAEKVIREEIAKLLREGP